MKTMKRVLFFVIAAVSAATLSAQVGTWRTHFVYNTVTNVLQTPNKVFALADGSLYSVDRRDKSVELYSKMNGLNDTNISAVAYNEQERTLVIAYANSNIDLITDDGIFNLPDLANKIISGSKKINSIYMDGRFAYLACDFGITVLDLDKSKRNFADTYIIGPGSTTIAVSSVTMSPDSIYAASGTDIYRALKSDKNLSNASKWEPMGKTGMLRPTYNNKMLAYWSGRLYVLQVNGTAAAGEVHWKADGSNTWNNKAEWTAVYSIRVQKDRLLMNNTNTIRSYNALQSYGTAINVTPYTAIPAVEYLAKEDEYWLAGNTAGLINWSKNEVYRLNGPGLTDARDIYTFGDKIFVNTSCKWDSEALSGDTRIAASIMIYSTATRTWKNILAADIPNVSNNQTRFRSITSVVADPYDNTHFFASTGYGGLYEFRDNAFFARYNSLNSPINDNNSNDDYQHLYGLTYDNEGENVWMFNSLRSSNSIKILKRDATWAELNYPRLNNIEKADRIYIDSHNNKWVNILRGGESVFVFNENGTFSNPNDDKTREFNSNPNNNFVDQDGNLFFATPRYFVEDKTGKMWIGTDSGPIIIENPENIFTSNRCTRIKIPRGDGFADYLLDGVRVTAIAVDGANRKWIATGGSGLFLVSANGTSIIDRFTVDNSPLLSDNINSITLSASGELFIATDLGICTYQTDATEAGTNAKSFEHVYAFPNPVTESYNGVISIVGLETDSNVKIADISGNIVYETTSRGGMATWDGKNKNGQKVSTGIYLVYCANDSVSESVATKIMIINK